MQDDEAAVVARAVAGDREAFGALYEQHQRRVLKHVYYRCPDLATAEDLAQTVWVNVWRAMPRYQQKGPPFLAFLLQCAQNEMVDYYRARHLDVPLDHALPAHHDPLMAGLTIEEALTDPNPTLSPDWWGDRLDDADALRSAWKRLNPEHQACLALVYASDLPVVGRGASMPYAAVSRALGKTEGTLRVMTCRARQALRKALERQAVTA